MTTNISAIDTSEEVLMSGIPPEIARRAVEWLLEWQSAEKPDSVWASLCQWRQRHHHHEQAWQQIEKVNKKLEVLAGPARSDIAHEALTTASMSRRQALKTLSVLAVIGGSGLLLSRQQPWREWSADHHTSTGQQQRISLQDGTDIILNSDTAINIRYTSTERRVVLLKGEVYIRTGKAGQSLAFILDTPQGQLQPLGTRFSVRLLSNHCRVAVYAGRVQVQPAQREQSEILDSGQSLQFTVRDWSNTVPVSEAEAAWTRGMIVASNMRLQDFLEELNRHRAGIIQCDPAIAHLKVSGTYPINHADKALKALTQALPIKLHMFTRYWVRVQPEQS